MPKNTFSSKKEKMQNYVYINENVAKQELQHSSGHANMSSDLIRLKHKHAKRNLHNLFDPSDPPTFHQMAPLRIQISKIFWGGKDPPKGSRPTGAPGCLRHPDRLHLQNDLLLQIFLRRLDGGQAMADGKTN